MSRTDDYVAFVREAIPWIVSQPAGTKFTLPDGIPDWEQRTSRDNPGRLNKGHSGKVFWRLVATKDISNVVDTGEKAGRRQVYKRV